MNKIIFSIVLTTFLTGLHAQEQSDRTSKQTMKSNPAPLKEWYRMAGSELIFSQGNVTANGQKLENKTRFSLFLHFQHLHNYNFNKFLGIYAGLSLINVGFINKLPIPGSTDSELRQRS
ncbi:MAG: hypothetical protein IT235_07255, partial [Bacteroidia bacterium]|nr:hypothetical protein [Bacteroidia bacterium]